MIRLYIAGPMTGLPNFNYPEFNRVARLLRDQGYEVTNPAEAYGGSVTLDRKVYLKNAMRDVAEVDAVCVLPGWDTHEHEYGKSFAQVEVDFAKALGHKIYPLSYFDSTVEKDRSQKWPGWKFEFRKATPSPAKPFEVKGQRDDEEVETTKDGGKHSKLPYRTDLIPPAAALAISEVLAEGAKRYNDGDDEHPNWRNIPIRDHINHLIVHLMAYLAGDTGCHHLTHAACRAMFACDLQEKPNG